MSFLRILLLLAGLLASQVAAELVLVTSNDYLEFNKTSGGQLFKLEIAGFKNYDFFSKDNVVSGRP